MNDLIVQLEILAVQVGRQLLRLHWVQRQILLDGKCRVDDVEHLGNRLHFGPLCRLYQEYQFNRKQKCMQLLTRVC